MMIVPIMSLSHDVAFIFMIHIRRVQIDRKESNVVSCEFHRCVRVARKWPRSLFFFFFLNNQSYDKGTCRPTRGRFFVRPTSKRDPLGESECTPPSIRGRVVAWARGRVVAWSRGQLRGRHLIGREEGQQALEQRDEMAVVTFELFRHQILVRHTVITNRP